MFENEANRIEFQQLEVIPILNQILSSSWERTSEYDYVLTREHAALALRCMVVDYQDLVREAGAIPELARLLACKQSSINSEYAVAWTLGKMADGYVHSQDAIIEARAIESIIQLLAKARSSTL